MPLGLRMKIKKAPQAAEHKDRPTLCNTLQKANSLWQLIKGGKNKRREEEQRIFSYLSTPPLCALFHPAACLWSRVVAGEKEGQTHVFYISVFLTDGRVATSPHTSQWHWHHAGYNGVIGHSTHKAALLSCKTVDISAVIWCSFQSLAGYEFYILR